MYVIATDSRLRRLLKVQLQGERLPKSPVFQQLLLFLLAVSDMSR